MISFTVPIEPVPFARAGSHGKRRFTPTKQANHMAVIRQYADAAMSGRPPMEGPLRMTVACQYARPASWSKKKQAATVWKTSTPDVDNLAKIVADSLNGCVWIDDAQVAELTVQKFYGDRALLHVTVTPCDITVDSALLS